MINAINVKMLTKTHVITARGPGEVALIARVLLKATTTVLFFPILPLGIANHASMINVYNVKMVTKTHAITARGQEDLALIAHAW